MSTKGVVFFINGVVKINGTDAATINAVDGGVVLTVDQEQKGFAGSAIADGEKHTTKITPKIKISGATFTAAIMEKLAGFNKAAGKMADAATDADVYKVTGADYFQRPEVDLLIQGVNDKTGKEIEIEFPIAVMTNAYELSLKKDDFTKHDLEFEGLVDLDDLTASIFEVRDEATA